MPHLQRAPRVALTRRKTWNWNSLQRRGSFFCRRPSHHPEILLRQKRSQSLPHLRRTGGVRLAAAVDGLPEVLNESDSIRPSRYSERLAKISRHSCDRTLAGVAFWDRPDGMFPTGSMMLFRFSVAANSRRTYRRARWSRTRTVPGLMPRT